MLENNKFESQYIQCPNCKERIPDYKGFTVWCDKCGWNLKPSEPKKTGSIMEKIDTSLGRKYSKKILNNIVSRANLRKNISCSMVLAYAISIFIHLISVILGICGIWLIVNSKDSWVGKFLGISILGVTYYLIPKPYKKVKGIVRREAYPELYSLIDGLGKLTGAPKIDNIAINGEFNAFYTQYGFLRKRVLGIGLPLFFILNNEEKLALLAHELAHSINGDIRRSYIVKTAIRSLQVWFDFIRPRRLFEKNLRLLGLAVVPINAILIMFSEVIYFSVYVLNRLTWADSQYSEYYADYKANKICGTDAVTGLLNKLNTRNTYETTITLYALNKNTKSLIDTFKERIKLLPEREIERIRRVGVMKNSRLDCSHPPTAYRIEFLENHYVKDNSFNDLDIRIEKIEKELSQIKEKIERNIIEEYRYHIS